MFQNCVRAKLHNAVAGPAMLGHHGTELQLIGIFLPERNRIGQNTVGMELARKRHNEAGVEAAGKERSHGPAFRQSTAHRGFELASQLTPQSVFVGFCIGIRLFRQRPKTARRKFSGAEPHDFGRKNFGDPA